MKRLAAATAIALIAGFALQPTTASAGGSGSRLCTADNFSNGVMTVKDQLSISISDLDTDDCYADVTSVVITGSGSPSNITISAGAFASATKLTRLTLPGNLATLTIGAGAFAGSGLSQIVYNASHAPDASPAVNVDSTAFTNAPSWYWFGADATKLSDLWFVPSTYPDGAPTLNGYRVLSLDPGASGTVAGASDKGQVNWYVFRDGSHALFPTVGTLGADNSWTVTLPSATRDGYDFGGWCLSAGCATPTSAGSTVQASGQTLQASWTITPVKPSFTAVTTLPRVTRGSSYTADLGVSGTPTPTCTWTNGSLPVGLGVTGCTITGATTTNATPGRYNVQVTATNSAGSTVHDYQLVVAEPNTIGYGEICAPSLGGGITNTSNAVVIDLAGFTGPGVTIAADAATDCRNKLTSVKVVNTNATRSVTGLSVAASTFLQEVPAANPMTKVTFEGGLTTLKLGEESFAQLGNSDQNKLAEITFPESLTTLSIGASAFAQASGVPTGNPDRSVVVPSEVQNLTIGNAAFAASGDPTMALTVLSNPTSMTIGNAVVSAGGPGLIRFAFAARATGSTTTIGSSIDAMTWLWLGPDGVSTSTWGAIGDPVTLGGYRTLTLSGAQPSDKTMYAYPDGTSATDNTSKTTWSGTGFSSAWVASPLTSPGTRTGYAFDGWCTVALTDGACTGGSVIADGAAASVGNAATTFYALWSLKPVFTTTSMPRATQSVAFSQTIAFSGGTPSCSLKSGTLPNGITLVGCTISGTPTGTGWSYFTITATIGTQSTDQYYKLLVAAPNTIGYDEVCSPVPGSPVSVDTTDGKYDVTIDLGGFTSTGVTIGYTATINCVASITKLTIVNSATSSPVTSLTIGNRAFSQVSAFDNELTSVTFPDGLKTLTIGDYAFLQSGNPTTALSSVTFPAGLDTLAVGVDAFQQTGVSSTAALVVVFHGAPGTLTVGENAFTRWNGSTSAPITVLAKTLTAPTTATIDDKGFVGATAYWFGADGGSWGNLTFHGYRTLTLADASDPLRFVYPDGNAYATPSTVTNFGDLSEGWTTQVPYRTKTGYTLTGWCSVALTDGACTGGDTLAVFSWITLTGDTTIYPMWSLTPVFTTTAMPRTTQGVAFSQVIGFANGMTPSCTVTSGSLPAGLTLNGCTLAGTPTATGWANFTITATNSGSTASQTYRLLVAAPNTIGYGEVCTPVAGGPVTVDATGGKYDVTIDLASFTGPDVTIASTAASGCVASLTKLTITNTGTNSPVTGLSIGNWTFTQQTGSTTARLSSVTFPDGLKALTIGEYAFYENSSTKTSLASVTFPAGLDTLTIRQSAFLQQSVPSTAALSVVFAGTAPTNLTVADSAFTRLETVNNTPQPITVLAKTVTAPTTTTIAANGFRNATAYWFGADGGKWGNLAFKGYRTLTLSGAQPSDRTLYVYPDGTSHEDPGTVTSLGDTSIGWTATLPSGGTRDGYTFAGWCTQNTQTCPPSSTIPEGGSYTLTRDTTLYALWTAPPPVITTTGLAQATTGTAYSQPITATGVGPLTCAITAGTLPARLSLSDCAITGTPIDPGSFPITVQVTGAGGTSSRDYTLSVEPTVVPPTSPTVTPPAVTPTVAATTTRITAGPVRYGTAATVTVAVSGGAGGKVSLRLGATGLGTATLANGTATFRPPATLAVGAWALTASYSGDATHLGSNATGVLTVTKAAAQPRITVRPKPTPHTWGTASVIVRGVSKAAKPSGTIRLKLVSGKRSYLLNDAHALKSGKTRFALRWLPKGTWKVYLAYSGDARYAGHGFTKVARIRVR